jgi:hypothetical protein
VTRKFIGYFRLLEAGAMPGCPVCCCVIEDGRRDLDALMYEQVNADTRRRLRATWGLCNWHSWTLSTLGTAKTGSAILYEDLLRVATQRLNERRDRRPPRFTRWLDAMVPARPRLVAWYMRHAHCVVRLTGRIG